MRFKKCLSLITYIGIFKYISRKNLFDRDQKKKNNNNKTKQQQTKKHNQNNIRTEKV